MAFDVMVPLKEALAQVSYDNSVRVVVLTARVEGFLRVRITSRRGWCRTSRT